MKINVETHKAWTPLVQFVVDFFLRIAYNKVTANSRVRK